MRKALRYEEMAELLELEGPVAFLFTADWCGDCQFIYPDLPELEASCAEFSFVQVDRDVFPELAKEWDVFGIPSLVVFQSGQEIGRFVDRNRKTKDELIGFLKGLERK